MMKKIIYILLLAVVTSFTFSSCEDMLTGDLDRNVEAEGIAKDTLYGYWGILRSLQGIANRYVILGECRGDLVEGTQYVQDSIHAILNFDRVQNGSDVYHQIKDYYHIINSCNSFLANCNTEIRNGLNQSIMQKEYAQVAAIRAWVYLQLVLTYGRVPYYDQPILSTADIEAFRNAEQWVDLNTLPASKVVYELEAVRGVAVPSYGKYGLTRVVHSSLCIFPQNLVLGDIYLLAAGSDKNYYIQAAQRYYDFLNSEKGGPLPLDNYMTLLKREGTKNEYSTSMNRYSSLFQEQGLAVGRNSELITVIPSTTNKLWGHVTRDINELFGFSTNISVSTSSTDTITTATVALQRNFEHQLNASKSYEAINKDQNFEVYIQNMATGQFECQVLDQAGDARYRAVTTNYTDTENGGVNEINFVTKQNPYGSFSMVYPVIYRKGNVWLRYATALNGAGFPGYAFAVLRHGLCNHPEWIPKSKYNFEPKTYEYWDDSETIGTDTIFYADDLPAGNTALDFMNKVYQTALAEGATFSLSPTTPQEIRDFCIKGYKDLIEDNDDTPEALFYNEVILYSSSKRIYHRRGKTFEEWCDGSYKVFMDFPVLFTSDEYYTPFCNYITKTEFENANNYPFMKYDSEFLIGTRRYDKSGNLYNSFINLYGGVTESNLLYGDIVNSISTSDGLTMGVHSRGCGTLELTNISGEPTYNYKDQINKMLTKYEGEAAMTEDDIYSNDTGKRDKVRRAIADLILEEMALETCFEGNRFFDLLCYSRFMNGMGQNGTERVARKIASRSGSINGNLYSKLLDQNNWYLPCP